MPSFILSIQLRFPTQCHLAAAAVQMTLLTMIHADNIPPDTDRLKMAHNQIRRLQREVVYVTLTVKQSAVISPLIFEHFYEKFAQYSRTPGLQKI